MKQLISLIALGLSLTVGAAHAAGHAASAPMAPASPAAATDGKTKQQTKMGDCNKEAKAKSLTGDERKAFMKSCLSSKPATQQSKMTQCNKDATGKKGDERKAFMKACLSK
jgi:hypothetical protein